MAAGRTWEKLAGQDIKALGATERSIMGIFVLEGVIIGGFFRARNPG